MPENNISLQNYIKDRKKIIGENTYNEIGISEPRNIFDAKDTGISGTQGIFKSLTYLIDIPQAINDGLDFLGTKTTDFVANQVRKLAGLSDEEISDINKNKENFLAEIKKKSNIRIEPGKKIREKFLTYEPTSKSGEYAEAIGEWAAPGGILGKGVKAKTALTATGAVGGATEQTLKDLSDSQLLGTAGGLATNIGLDLLYLKRGNVAGVAKNLIPKQEVIENAKKLQQYAQSRGLTLTAGEATNKASIIATEGNMKSSLEGSKIMDDFYEMRPEQIKQFIKNWGKEYGLITDATKLNRNTLLTQIKKSAIALAENRTRLWEKSGGLKFKETFFPQVEVDNIVAKIAKLQTDKLNKQVAPLLEDYKLLLQNSDAKGGNLHEVYRQIRDHVLSISQNPNKTASLLKEKRILEEVSDNINTMLSKNKDFAKAQEKYQQFTKAYFEPIDKIKLFKSINTAGWVNDANTVGKLYRYMASDKITPRDIEKIAKSFAASGDKKQWRLIISSFFEENFNKALVDNMSEGLNIGSVLNKAITGSPKNRANFAEMLYQLAKQQGFKGPRTEFIKGVDSFSAVLKATGRNAKAGSPTASRSKQYQDLSRNLWSETLGGQQGGVPIISYFKNKFSDRSLSKNSLLLSKALTSEKGIDALIDLSQKFTDANAAVATLRAMTQIMDEQE